MTGGERVNTMTDHGCFGCGSRNPIGLRLEFYRDGESVRASFTPRVEHEGYLRVIHGGIISALLDEAMSWAVISSGRLAVTARMSVQFKRPVPSDEPLTIVGRVERDRGRLVEAQSELRDRSGTLLAQASATFARVSAEQQREWEALYFPDEADARLGT